MTVSSTAEGQQQSKDPEDTTPAGPLLLDGRIVARQIREQIKTEAEQLKSRFGLLPGLAVLRVGADPASASYSGRITRAFADVGLPVTVVELPAAASRSMLQAELGRLNVLPEIAAVIVQMPLPPHIDLTALIDVLDPNKDVDGIHPINVGNFYLGLDCYMPATPAGGIALLDYYGIGVAGKRALVIGRSQIVGRPLAQLLITRNATVTVAHSHSADLDSLLAQADIVATAIGKPALIGGSNIKQGAVVLDFGASMIEGHMVGDVEFATAQHRASAITPVPGGTGPMTNAMLLRNTLKAIRRYFGVAS